MMLHTAKLLRLLALAVFSFLWLQNLRLSARFLFEQKRGIQEDRATNSHRQSSSNASVIPSPVYYYHDYGRFQYQFDPLLSDQLLHARKTLFLIDQETPATLIGNQRIHHLYNTLVNKTPRQLKYAPRTIPTATDTWVLPNPLLHPTRNHDSILVQEKNGDTTTNKRLLTVLGRHSRHVQELHLATGQQRAVRTQGATDPDGYPLDDLNHVSAVLLRGEDANDEIWLPCGFHGDRVNGEVSAQYVRIVNVSSLEVRLGPRLPTAGGACVATTLQWWDQRTTNTTTNNNNNTTTTLVCAIGGTQGTHDRGIFLRSTSCYDRQRERWVFPIPDLPYGLDHGSLAVIPPDTCTLGDPERWLLLNFRTRPYGDAHSEILAYDLPVERTAEQLLEPQQDNMTSSWYIYHNSTLDDFGQLQDFGRDASGIVVTKDGRHIINFGGTYHYLDSSSGKRRRGRFSMIRSFDVCQKRWDVIGDLGLPTFALQTAAVGSDRAITCGGEAPLRNSNNPWCLLTRFSNGMLLADRYDRDSW